MRTIGGDSDKWAKNRENFALAMTMLKNPTAPVEFARHTLDADMFSLQHAAVKHPGLTPEDLDPLLQHGGTNDLQFHALRHPNVTREQLDSVIEKAKQVETATNAQRIGLAVQHQNVDPKHIEWAAKHPNPDIRAHVALRHDLPYHLQGPLLKDSVQHVRAAAGIGSMNPKEWDARFKGVVREFCGKNNLIHGKYL